MCKPFIYDDFSSHNIGRKKTTDIPSDSIEYVCWQLSLFLICLFFLRRRQNRSRLPVVTREYLKSNIRSVLYILAVGNVKAALIGKVSNGI